MEIQKTNIEIRKWSLGYRESFDMKRETRCVKPVF